MNRLSEQPRKKTTQAIHKEVSREAAQLIGAIFRDRKAAGNFDLESYETAIRAAMHHAGATALTQLLQFDPPDAHHLTIPCPCGHEARFKEMRTKAFLSVVGPVRIRRPYYLCSRCSKGQHPVDCELGIAGLESSPGVRRMEAVVGSDSPFGRGCEPLKLLAGLDVTAKAIDRTAETIGDAIARRELEDIACAKQLVLPIIPNRTFRNCMSDGRRRGSRGLAETQGRVG